MRLNELYRVDAEVVVGPFLCSCGGQVGSLHCSACRASSLAKVGHDIHMMGLLVLLPWLVERKVVCVCVCVLVCAHPHMLAYYVCLSVCLYV